MIFRDKRFKRANFDLLAKSIAFFSAVLSATLSPLAVLTNFPSIVDQVDERFPVIFFGFTLISIALLCATYDKITRIYMIRGAICGAICVIPLTIWSMVVLSKTMPWTAAMTAIGLALLLVLLLSTLPFLFLVAELQYWRLLGTWRTNWNYDIERLNLVSDNRDQSNSRVDPDA